MLRNHSQSMTITAPTCVGTLLWMAPELFKGDLPSSKASDIYALGIVTFEVSPRWFLRRTNTDERSCRFSRTKHHSHGFLPMLRLCGSSAANDPRGHQTEISLASRTRSGFSRQIVGMEIQPSGQISHTSCPSLKRLPAVSSPRPWKQSRISVWTTQPPPEAIRRHPIVLIVQPVVSPPLIPNAFTPERCPVQARSCTSCLLHRLRPCVFLRRLWTVYDSPDKTSKHTRLVRDDMDINPAQL